MSKDPISAISISRARSKTNDEVLYEKLGVEPEPFENVEYFAPYTAKGLALNTFRNNEALLDNVTPLTWGLREVLQFAEVLLNKDDVDAKADALIDFITENVVDKEFKADGVLSKDHKVESFADLDAWFRDVLQGMEKKNGESWRTHHVATIRKVRNRLSNISTRCAGLVTDSGAVSDLPFGSFEDRTVYVVDVANLEEDAQDLIFARIVSKLREHLERRDLGVKHLVVFVDELNKYAPGDGQRHLRQENAARHRRARAIPRTRALQRAAVPVAGSPASGWKLGDGDCSEEWIPTSSRRRATRC